MTYQEMIDELEELANDYEFAPELSHYMSEDAFNSVVQAAILLERLRELVEDV